MLDLPLAVLTVALVLPISAEPLAPVRAAAVRLRQEPPAAKPQVSLRPYQLDSRVDEEITLPDLAGKKHALFAANEGKALLLVFWSRKDPVSRFYVKPLTELQKARADKLTIVLVNANHNELVAGGDPLAKLRETVAEEKTTLPVLLDHENKLADDFRAKANGQVFLIDANRFLRYHGGIDDDPDGERAKQKVPRSPWLDTALDEVLKGEKPKAPWTNPAGLPIKRAPKAK